MTRERAGCSDGLRDRMNKSKTAGNAFFYFHDAAGSKESFHYCCFCCVSVVGLSANKRHQILYRNLNSAMRPIPRDDSLPVLEPPENEMAFLK
jgi:hypothetical protein